MNNIKLGNNIVTWNIVCIVAVLLGLGAVVYDFISPVPDAKAVAKEKRDQRDILQMKNKIAESDLAKAEEETKKYLWRGTAEEVTPQILQQVTTLASSKGVTVKSFRPQRSLEGETLEQLNYVLIVEGGYGNVLSLSRTLDEPSRQFSVRLLQVSSTDGGSDKVNATVGLVAYTKKDENG